MKTLRVENKQLPYLYLLIFMGFMVLLLVVNPNHRDSIYLEVAFQTIVAASIFSAFTRVIEMNEEHIRMDTNSDCFMMNWDEVERIELSPTARHHITFYSGEKVLSVSGFNAWSGNDKTAMLELFNRQIEKRQIPVGRVLKRRFFQPKSSGVTQQIPCVKVNATYDLKSLLFLILLPLFLMSMALFLISTRHMATTSNLLWLSVTLAVVTQSQIVSFNRRCIELNQDVIRVRGGHTHELRWDEVERVEMPAANSREVVFYGQDKVLAIAGPDWWQGDDKETMLELFNRQIETREIPLIRELRFKKKQIKNTNLSTELLNLSDLPRSN